MFTSNFEWAINMYPENTYPLAVNKAVNKAQTNVAIPLLRICSLDTPSWYRQRYIYAT